MPDLPEMTVGRMSIADWRAEALRVASRELADCLRLVAAARTGDNMLLANAARERFAGLVLHRDVEEARAVLEEREYLAIFQEQLLVNTLLDLPSIARPFEEVLPGLTSNDPRKLVVGMLVRAPYEMEGLAEWIGDADHADLLIFYVSWQPKCFDRDEQRQRYLDFVTALCHQCADLLNAGPPPPLRRLIAHVVGSLRTGVIYSCEGSLRAYAEAKGRLLSAHVGVHYPALTLPPAKPSRLPSDRPIRLGLLWNDIDWRTENTVGVAAMHSLRDYDFHVTSILHHRTYHTAIQDRPTIMADLLATSDAIVDLDDLPSIAEKCVAIRALDLDCLMFMNNVTFGFNDYVALATLRLARWQAVNQSAVFTTGLETIDLYLSGALSERSADPQQAYTETLMRVPGTCLIFDRAHADAHVTPRGIALALRDPCVETIFGSGANLYKVHPRLSETWARVLAETSGSRLVLYPFNPNWDLSYPVDRFLRRFRAQLAEHGVDPDRVTVAGPWRDATAVNDLLAACDIYLDSFPHSGGLSSLDAIRLGVPVVTIGGEMQRENQSADLLDLLGCDEFVTTSIDDYVAMAARLAREPDYLAAFRARIIRSIDTAPFYDLPAFSRNFAVKLKEALVDG